MQNQTVLMAFDSEDNSNGRMFMVNFFDGHEHKTFRSAEKAITWLMEFAQERTGNKRGCQIWAVNCEYDLNNLFKNDNDLIQRTYIESRFISARIKGTNVSFLDTLNHWKLSVLKMGEKIGLKKLDTGGSFNNVRYCRRDTEICFRFVERMLGYYGELGVKSAATIGSTALKFFKEKYHRADFPAFEHEEIEFMRDAARGGRVEIFNTKPIWGNIQYVDFNSLYPAQMLKPLPRLETRYWTTRPDYDGRNGIAEITVSSPETMEIPYLGTVSDDGKFIFPLGTWRGRYSYFEIREARKLGYRIRKTHRALEFGLGESPIMRDFVEDLYAKRLEAMNAKDALLSDTCKLLLNNLFGKFLQGNEKTLVVPYEPNRLKPGDIYSLERPEAILRKVKGPYPRHTNVIWSAYITAFARHALWCGLERVRLAGGTLIYCDTDSIIFEHPTPLFENSLELGGLKSEGEFCFAHFKQPKMYKLINKKDESYYKTKGVPKKFQKDFFEDDFVFFDSPNRFKASFRSAVRSAGVKGISDYVNIWEIRLKTMNSKYDKREILKNGETKPRRI